MAKTIQLQPGEQIIKQEKGMLRKGKISAHAGQLYLTNQRLVFRQNPNPFHSLLIGGLGGWMAGKGANLQPMDLALAGIAGVERTKFGRCDKVLLVRTASDEHQVILSKTIDEWVASVQASS